MDKFIGSEFYDEDHCYLIVCNGLFVSSWYSNGHSSSYGSDGCIDMADYYTFDECLYFMVRVWNGKANFKIIRYKEKKSKDA